MGLRCIGELRFLQGSKGTSLAHQCLTVAEAAERLKLDPETIRRLFINEPGVIVICVPKKGKRAYRTRRIPEPVFRRVVARFTQVA